MLSDRDTEAGSFADMVQKYEALTASPPVERASGI